MKHATKGETAWGGEESWFKIVIDIIGGYAGPPEPLSFLLNCMRVPVDLRLYSDIIDKTLHSYNQRGRY